ncbi:alkylation response protein AidB-like acyl-CoA dehydrogenase [Bradyrhizobium sp. JR6.1]
MNFDDTPREAAFRAEAKAWIAANAPKQYEEELRKASLGRVQLKGANILEVAKAWQKKKADAGWACLHWPKEYGGRGSSPIERVIWQQEEGPFGRLSSMFYHWPRHVRPDHDGVRRRGAEAQISAAARLR